MITIPQNMLLLYDSLVLTAIMLILFMRLVQSGRVLRRGTEHRKHTLDNLREQVEKLEHMRQQLTPAEGIPALPTSRNNSGDEMRSPT